MLTNLSEIELAFKIGHCNGTMSMQVFVDDVKMSNFDTFNSDSIIVKHQFNWPATIKIVTSNKDLSCDTLVDNNGNIVADKFIQLTKILVDRVDPGMPFLNSLILDTGENKINSLYWGFNGIVNLIFDESDSFLWHLKQKITHDNIYVGSSPKN
jgi:hypothetical protein